MTILIYTKKNQILTRFVKTIFLVILLSLFLIKMNYTDISFLANVSYNNLSIISFVYLFFIILRRDSILISKTDFIKINSTTIVIKTKEEDRINLNELKIKEVNSTKLWKFKYLSQVEIFSDNKTYNLLLLIRNQQERDKLNEIIDKHKCDLPPKK